MASKVIKIANLVLDDKFIDDLIEVMDYTSSSSVMNEYIYICDEKPSYRYVQCSNKIQIVNHSNFINFLISNQYNVVIIHGLGTITSILITEIPESIKVVWVAWGYDIYRTPVDEEPFIKINLFKPLTRKASKTDFLHRLRKKRAYIHYIINRNEVKKAISRIDYFSGVLPMEYQLMKRLDYFHAKEMRFNYFKLNNQTIVDSDTVLGSNILLGNSASPINNHIDAMALLNKVDLKGKNIICPLSYGGSKRYVARVKEQGIKYWGDSFVYLCDFMQADEYWKLLNSCGYAIFYNESQAAMGNIFNSIKIGRKVFLSPTSIPFKFLTSLGIKVYSFEDDLSQDEISMPLSNSIIDKNRHLLSQFYSNKVLLNNIYEFYKILN
jgi:dTDP-N-acetylfucosamine:lipid II N-acetylfucosaminyltransferase